MAPTRAGETSSWHSKRTVPPSIRFSVENTPFKLDRGLLAKVSAKLATLLDENPCSDLTAFFQNIKADPEALELIAKFCHGFEVQLTSENIIPVICLAHNLEMTDRYSPNNLLEKALSFMENNILSSWDETVRSLRALSSQSIQQASEIGLFKYAVSALSGHAMSNPSLVAQPITIDPSNKPINARRKLFSADHSTTPLEDLTTLPLEIYAPVIEAMAQAQVPQENITGSLCEYLKNHPSDREVIEAIERFLPSNCAATTLLFEMYTQAVSMEVASGCITGLETRIGKQLDRATVKDLLALELGVESLRQILKGYYGNYIDHKPTGLVAVAELMEGYLIEIAKERELETSTFIEVAETVTSTFCLGTNRCSDGMYRAVDVYLDTHKELTDLEREEVCRILDFQKMSPQACEHAALNQRLPLRVVLQALFVSQLQLRDDISKAVRQSCDISNVEEEDGHKEAVKLIEHEEWGDERRDIEGWHHKNSCGMSGKKKPSLWKEVKRKLGCISSNSYETLHDCNCQVKKRKKAHPKK